MKLKTGSLHKLLILLVKLWNGNFEKLNCRDVLGKRIAESKGGKFFIFLDFVLNTKL